MPRDGWSRAGRFFLIAAGVLALAGGGLCAVAFGVSAASDDPYGGIVPAIFGMFALYGAGGSLVVAGLLYLVAALRR